MCTIMHHVKNKITIRIHSEEYNQNINQAPSSLTYAFKAKRRLNIEDFPFKNVRKTNSPMSCNRHTRGQYWLQILFDRSQKSYIPGIYFKFRLMLKYGSILSPPPPRLFLPPPNVLYAPSYKFYIVI